MRHRAKNFVDVSLPDIYQFGIYDGKSMLVLNRVLPNYRKMFGFDSFVGIPKEKQDPHSHDDWLEGFCNISKKLNVQPTEAIDIITNKLKNEISNFDIIPGFFCDTLTDKIIQQYDMQPAQYVDIDVDIYSSCVELLDFMLRNELMVKNTVFYADDYGGTLEKAPEGCGGESRAIKEVFEKYNKKYIELYRQGNVPHIGVFFKVV